MIADCLTTKIYYSPDCWLTDSMCKATTAETWIPFQQKNNYFTIASSSSSYFLYKYGLAMMCVFGKFSSFFCVQWRHPFDWLRLTPRTHFHLLVTFCCSSQKFTHFCFFLFWYGFHWQHAASPNKRLRLSWVHNMLSTRLQLHAPCKSWEIEEDDFFFVMKHIFKIALSAGLSHFWDYVNVVRWTKKNKTSSLSTLAWPPSQYFKKGFNWETMCSKFLARSAYAVNLIHPSLWPASQRCY